MKFFLLLVFVISIFGHEDPTQDPEYCSNHPNATLPYPENCSKYYECTEDVLEAKDCPLNEHFNAETKLCDSKENAKCEVKQEEHDEPTDYQPKPYNIEVKHEDRDEGQVEDQKDPLNEEPKKEESSENKKTSKKPWYAKTADYVKNFFHWG